MLPKFFSFILVFLFMLVCIEMWAEGQLPQTNYNSSQDAIMRSRPEELQYQTKAPGSGLSSNMPPAYADLRFITHQGLNSAITEKLDTSVKDGAIYVNSAYYIMGGSQGEYNVKTPGHRVMVRSFWISPYEVYWKLWNDVLRWAIKRGYRFARPGKARHVMPLSFGLDNPVYNISWFDAIVWCNAYSQARGLEPVYRYNPTVSNYVVRSSADRNILRNLYIDYNANGYRLPTEAEWELAARGGVAGKGHLFAGSNKEVDVAWYWDNTLGQRHSHSVGLLRPNELGLYDMNGNLAEWTNDWYVEDYYYNSPINNPLGPGSGKYRVLRGGSFLSRPKEDFFTRQGRRIRKRQTWLAVEMRERLKPHQRRNWIGFRPVRIAVFRPVEYLQSSSDLGDRPVPSTPEDLNNEINDSSPYIYSLDPNYIPKNQPYRNNEINDSSPYIYSLDPNYIPKNQPYRDK